MAIGRTETKSIGLASLGAMLEYYDFVVYAFVAAALSRAFFPSEGADWVKVAQVFSIYAVGYFVRPVAGLVIAHFADRIGRKRLFIFTVLLMSVPTFLIGLLPTYEQVGVLAPVLLLICRVLQGCAVGGELPSAAVYVSEYAPPQRLYLASGTLHGIIHLGLLLGAGSAALASWIASIDPSLSTLAWRLPFLVGGACGLLAGYLRRHLGETPLFTQLRQTRQQRVSLPIGTILRSYRAPCLFALGLMFMQCIVSAVYFQFLNSYLITQFQASSTAVLTANTAGTLALAGSMPIWGWVADRFGRNTTIALGTMLSAATTVFFFQNLPTLMASGTGLMWALIPVGLFGGSVTALVPGLFASLFPTAVRQSGYALPYNIGAALFAGPAPLLLAYLVRTSDVLWPMYAMLIACAVAATAAVLARHVPQHLGQASVDTSVAAEAPPLGVAR